MTRRNNSVFLIFLYFLVGVGSSWEAVATERTLRDIRHQLGISLDGFDDFRVTKDITSKGRAKRFLTVSARKGDSVIKIHVIKDIDDRSARRYVDDKRIVINALYASAPSPYPGVISDAIECAEEFMPQQRSLKVGKEEISVMLLFSTPRFTYGACAEDLIAYRALLAFVYNEQRKILYRIDLFIPKEAFHETEALSALGALAFLPTDASEKESLTGLQGKGETKAKPRGPAEANGSLPAPRRLNLILIAFEPLGASHVGSYGYERDTTPNLDRFSEDAFLFTNAISPSSWTLPVFMSWFTSLYPSQHGIVNKYRKTKGKERGLSTLSETSPSAVTLAQVMKENGYATAGFTGGAGVSGDFGYNQGFDTYADQKTFAGFGITFPAAEAWLKTHAGQRFFLFVQGYDVHGRYELPRETERRFVDPGYDGKYQGTIQEYWELRNLGLYGTTDEEYWRLNRDVDPLSMAEEDARFWNALYDGRIHEADRKFGEFMAALARLGLAEETIVVVSSGSGNEYHEHGRFDHGFSLYEELIHVPLIIRVPGHTGRVIEQQVRTIDLMPTVLDLLGMPAENGLVKQMQGTSLVPLLNGGELSLDAFSETDYLFRVFKRSLRTSEGWKYIYSVDTEERELYNLKEDPRELQNLIETERAVASELERKLFGHLDAIGRGASREFVRKSFPSDE